MESDLGPLLNSGPGLETVPQPVPEPVPEPELDQPSGAGLEAAEAMLAPRPPDGPPTGGRRNQVVLPAPESKIEPKPQAEAEAQAQEDVELEAATLGLVGLELQADSETKLQDESNALAKPTTLPVSVPTLEEAPIEEAPIEEAGIGSLSEVDNLRMLLRERRKTMPVSATDMLSSLPAEKRKPDIKKLSLKHAAKTVARMSDAEHDRQLVKAGLGANADGMSPRDRIVEISGIDEDGDATSPGRARTHTNFFDSHEDQDLYSTAALNSDSLRSDSFRDESPRGVGSGVKSIKSRSKRREDIHEMVLEQLEQEEKQKSGDSKAPPPPVYICSVDRVRAWRKNPLCRTVLEGWEQHACDRIIRGMIMLEDSPVVQEAGCYALMKIISADRYIYFIPTPCCKVLCFAVGCKC